MHKQTSPCLSVATTMEASEILSSRLVDLGALAIEQRDHTTMLTPESGTALLVAGFEDEPTRDKAYKDLLQDKKNIFELHLLDIPPGSWETAWQAFFKPVFLTKLAVVTPWMLPIQTELCPIVIDPGQAFGTGGHATTRMLLSLLEQRAKAGNLPKKVLDVGCGSGILAIAAAKLGSTNVSAIDIDEESVTCTLTNGRANGVAEALTVRAGTAGDLSGEWPLVLANLQLSIFISEAAKLVPLVGKGKEVLLSGLLEGQADACLALWPGFDLTATNQEGEWIALALKRQE